MKDLILVIVALLISIVLLPIGFVYQLISSTIKSMDKYLFRIAKSIDQLGNVVCVGLMDDFLIKKSSVNRFGNEDETISSVLGKNKLSNHLTIIGKCLVELLNAIQKNHVEKAIEQSSVNN